MLRFIWPMKAANDDAFRASNKKKTIYDDVTVDTPEYSFDMELMKYNENRWKKGFIHHVAPAVAYGTVVGFLYGLYESRRGLVRHVGRPRIILGNTMTTAGLALFASSIHQAILMACDYKAAVWQPVVSGILGGASYSAIMQGFDIARGASGGFVIGLAYTVICIGAEKYNDRALENFCATQQMNEVPVTKVAPELQRVYRAWLYDHRPLEDMDKARRNAAILDRHQADTRLDATTFVQAMNVDKLDWIEFPEWWPLKFAPKTEKAKLVEQRMRDDAYERRKLALLENQVMLSHPLRTEGGADISDQKLDMPRDRS